MRTWEQLSRVEQLQAEWSDFHKAFYGFRPRYSTEEQWNDIAYLEAQMQQICDEMDELKKTFEGREQLRQNGWVVEETDPTLAKYAKWLAEERDREYREWADKLEREYV